jgi:hypothetical protein
MIPKEQIAHDLAIAYINNKYGVEVSGDFDVSTYGDDVIGSGSVSTEYLPDIVSSNMIKVGTGEKGLLGKEKKKWVQDGVTYPADKVFRDMNKDYHAAYERFITLLSQ